MACLPNGVKGAFYVFCSAVILATCGVGFRYLKKIPAFQLAAMRMVTEYLFMAPVALLVAPREEMVPIKATSFGKIAIFACACVQ